MIVLVGIFGGFGTLTEAGAITVVYTFLVEWMVSPTFSPRRFASVATECVTVIGGVLLIVGVAVGFTNYLVMAHVPELMKQWALTNIHSKIVFLLLLNVVLLVKGSFMDVFSAIIVTGPAAQAHRRYFRHRPGATGNHLPRQRRTGLPDAAGRHEPVLRRVPVQAAHDRGVSRHPAVLR